MAVKIGSAAASAAADAVTDMLDGGTIQVRTGAAPTNAGDADSGTLLAELTFGTPAFGAAVAGVATANAITQDASANNTGTAGHFRCKTSGAVVVFQGNVTALGGGGDMQVSSTSVVTGVPFSITSCTYTHPLA
jgi:hypothetical protein